VGVCDPGQTWPFISFHHISSLFQGFPGSRSSGINVNLEQTLEMLECFSFPKVQPSGHSEDWGSVAKCVCCAALALHLLGTSSLFLYMLSAHLSFPQGSRVPPLTGAVMAFLTCTRGKASLDFSWTRCPSHQSLLCCFTKQGT
jgi:hypothetical protein